MLPLQGTFIEHLVYASGWERFMDAQNKVPALEESLILQILTHVLDFVVVRVEVYTDTF